MANKSSFNLVIDNGSGVVLTVLADSSGFLTLQLSDGKNPLALSLASADALALRTSLYNAVSIRQQIPQS